MTETANPDPAPSPEAEAKPKKPQLDLAAFYPDCFDWKRPCPLKIGIREDLIADGHDQKMIHRALGHYCSTRRYLEKRVEKRVQGRSVQGRFFLAWLGILTPLTHDFILELSDGRILALEYKGAHLATADDAKEKRNVGGLWASKSGGKSLFLMAENKDAQGRDVRAQLIALIG